MRWPWKMRRDERAEQNGREAVLEKWAARARLDEQQRRWPEVRRVVDHFTTDAERALRRRQ